MAAAQERTSNARISAVIAGVTLAITAAIVVLVPPLATDLTRAKPAASTQGGIVMIQGDGRVIGGRVRAVPAAPVTVVAAPPGGAPGFQLPSAGSEQPPDPEAARRDVTNALTTLFGGKNDRPTRLSALDDPSNVDSAMDAVRKDLPEASDTVEAEMAEIVFVDGTNASFLFRLRYTGAPLLPSRVGTARLVDGRWLITRATLCEVMSAAGHPCEPPAPTPST